LREKITKLNSDNLDLDVQYAKIVKEKHELEDKFEKITIEVKKHANL